MVALQTAIRTFCKLQLFDTRLPGKHITPLGIHILFSKEKNNFSYKIKFD